MDSKTEGIGQASGSGGELEGDASAPAAKMPPPGTSTRGMPQPGTSNRGPSDPGLSGPSPSDAADISVSAEQEAGEPASSAQGSEAAPDDATQPTQTPVGKGRKSPRTAGPWVGKYPRWVAYLALGVGLAVFAMGQTILFAVLGPLSREIGLTEIQVGAMVSAAAMVIAVISPWWGRRSTWLGRRWVLVFGLVSYCLTMLLFVAVTIMGLEGLLSAALVFPAMLGARILYALLSAGIQPAATAFVADTTSGSERAAGLAFMGAAFGIGTVAGPALGALLSFFGLITPLAAVSGLALAAAIAIAIILPPTEREKHDHAQKGPGFTDPRIISFLFLMFCVLMAGSAAQQTAAFFLQDQLDLNARQTARSVGLVMAVSAVAMILVQGGIVQWLKPPAAVLVRLGFGLAFAGFVVLLFSETFLWFLCGYALVGAALGFLNPGLMTAASLSVRDREQGHIAGLMGSAMAAGFVVGPILGTALYALKPELPFAVNCVFTFILFLFAFRVRFFRPGHRRRQMAGSRDSAVTGLTDQDLPDRNGA